MTLALDITNLQKTYSNGTRALKGINLQIQSGDFFALLGANGAGKSTTIGMISSLINKTAGKIRILGYDLDTQAVLAKKALGVVPQEFNFNQFEKVEDVLIHQAGYYGITARVAKERVAFYLKALDLEAKRSVPSMHLSGGMKRRLMIARALIHQPKLLILDEPTAGVDIEIRRSMWQFLAKINREGTTIILTTHYLEEAEQLCRNVAIIDHGEIVVNQPIRQLLHHVQHRSFVLTCTEPLRSIPETTDSFCFKAGQDPECLEVSLDKHSSLNHLFAYLDRKGLKVSEIRTKANRLEELFVDLIGQGKNSE